MLESLPPSTSWQLSPAASDYAEFAWGRGVFETARRPFTELVEGTIRAPHHTVMVTLHGGARRHRMQTECGYRYDGPDRSGSVSFLPAGCERRVRLEAVAWEWAAFGVAPELLDLDCERSGGHRLHSFSSAEDAFLFGLLAELRRLHADGGLDAGYCDAMSVTVSLYLRRRYLGGMPEDRRSPKLTAWRLRRVTDYVEAHIEGEIRIAALAALVGLSEGHFHRAFRQTTGETPLRFITRKRIERAVQILSDKAVPVTELAFQVGFASPSHFTKLFRQFTGLEPSRFRKELGGKA